MEEGLGRAKDVFAAVSWVRGSVGLLLQGPCLVRPLIYRELLDGRVERVEERERRPHRNSEDSSLAYCHNVHICLWSHKGRTADAITLKRHQGHVVFSAPMALGMEWKEF